MQRPGGLQGAGEVSAAVHDGDRYRRQPGRLLQDLVLLDEVAMPGEMGLDTSLGQV